MGYDANNRVWAMANITFHPTTPKEVVDRLMLEGALPNGSNEMNADKDHRAFTIVPLSALAPNDKGNPRINFSLFVPVRSNPYGKPDRDYVKTLGDSLTNLEFATERTSYLRVYQVFPVVIVEHYSLYQPLQPPSRTQNTFVYWETLDKARKAFAELLKDSVCENPIDCPSSCQRTVVNFNVFVEAGEFLTGVVVSSHEFNESTHSIRLVQTVDIDVETGNIDVVGPLHHIDAAALEGGNPNGQISRQQFRRLKQALAVHFGYRR